MPPRSGKTLEKSSRQCPYSTCQSSRARGFFPFPHFHSFCLVLSVLPLPLREAAAAVQSGGYASHPQENLQGAVWVSPQWLNDWTMLASLPRPFLRLSDGLLANFTYSREPGLTVGLPEWQPSGLSFGLAATFGDRLRFLSRFSLANSQRTTDVAPYWPTKDAGPTPIKVSSVLQLASTVDLIQTSKQPPIRTQRSSDTGSHTGIVPAWTNGKDL